MGETTQVFNQPHVWEAEGSSRIPFWAYTDEAIYKKNRINESEITSKDERIVCDECGWSWDLSDGGNDPYTCHKCGHENEH